MPAYDVALICENGHVINDSATRYPERSSRFCASCGAPGISACPECKSNIQGRMIPQGGWIIGGGLNKPTAYCPACGKPFPWTSKKVAAAKALIAEVEGLDADERQALSDTLPNLIGQTSDTELALLRYKKLSRKIDEETQGGLRHLLSDVVISTIKDRMFPPEEPPASGRGSRGRR